MHPFQVIIVASIGFLIISAIDDFVDSGLKQLLHIGNSPADRFRYVIVITLLGLLALQLAGINISELYDVKLVEVKEK